MKLYKILQTDQTYTTLPEALREAVLSGSVKIIIIEREDESRHYSMSKYAPPLDYSWHHTELGEQEGDGIVSYANLEAQREFRRLRREWLSSFELKVSEESEQGYRYWRWSDTTGEVLWWERRPWGEDFKGEPGFWPDRNVLLP